MEENKPRPTSELCDDIVEKIDRTLAYNDFIWCVNDRVAGGELSEQEANEARDAFDRWILTGDSGIQETLFE